MAKAFPTAIFALLAVAGCNGKGSEAAEKKITKPPVQKLETKDTKVGTGPMAATGDLVFMKYKGELGDGTVFDSSEKQGNKPYAFKLGEGGVIKGWDQGIPGMKVGGIRELSIPWSLAYGAEGRAPTIPPKADLYFTVELLDRVKKGDELIIDRKTIKPGSGPGAKVGDTISINYVGKLVGGAVFDDKFQKKPYTFKLGDPVVYEFFQQGILGAKPGDGMKKGGEYELRVPPDAGFGPMGNASVEGNQILYITIDVVDIKPGKK